MPRATRASDKTATTAAKAKPYSRTTSSASNTKPIAPSSESKPTKAPRKTKDGKDSHLYTDDNPTTTLHGTGFKDAATANHTIELVSKRSLLYQFQTINTMYHRAAHHPSGKTNQNIQAAMKIFRLWLDETYVAARAAQRDYPLLKKDVVELYLPLIREKAAELGIETEWTEKYAELGKGKRLANVLMDDLKPEERDLAVVRQNALDEFVEKDFGGDVPLKSDKKLFGDDGKSASDLHLKLISYGFSPVRPEVLSNDAKRTLK